MKYQAFEDIVRNLLVFLKGQIPSLMAKENREEIRKQIQSMTFSLRSAIVQLEGAAFQDPRVTEDYQSLEKELHSLKQTNAKLEESLFLEMKKSQELGENLAKLGINNNQANTTQLEKTIKQLESELESAKKNAVAGVDSKQLTKLNNEIAHLESQLGKYSEINNQLRQALQNKDIELTKTKGLLTQAIKFDTSDMATLERKLHELDTLKEENASLKLKMLSGTPQPSQFMPDSELFRNNLAAAEAKIKFLEASLEESRTELEKTREEKATNTPTALLQAKEQLERRVIDLEATLKGLIKAKETNASQENFAFTPEECVFLFETLATTSNRLAHSLENRDLYMRSRESITLLEKNNAIQKIPSIGQIFDAKIHKAAKSFKSDCLPDNIIIHEEAPGFISGTRIIQKPLVWVAKSTFYCAECHNLCRPHEFFCPKCGLELTAPDGTSKRDLTAQPASVEANLPLLDELTRQGNIKVATSLLSLVARDNPTNPELIKRQALLQLLEKSQKQPAEG